LKDAVDLIEQAEIALAEASSECENMLSKIDSAPWRIQEIDDRLDGYAELLSRCGGSLENLLSLRERLNLELDEYDVLETELERLKSIIPEKSESIHKAANLLTKARNEAAEALENSVQNELKLLGMPDAAFRIVMNTPPVSRSCLINDTLVCADGAEIPEFLFSGNPGIEPAPLSSVASGGEMSRVSLVLKLALVSITQAPTMIFDEIDSGVGGETANLLADSLGRVAEKRQVIVITHLPQIASRAQRHLAVIKNVVDGLPDTHVNTLSDRRSRIEELARLLGGGTAALEHAEKLMQSNSLGIEGSRS
jgi:DNA repair protein RecN (Recombination protein N)